MLPEAVAVVVAPRDVKAPFGVFRLTDEPPDQGLQLVQSCEVSALSRAFVVAWVMRLTRFAVVSVLKWQ
jgi:hypothetical protein